MKNLKIKPIFTRCILTAFFIFFAIWLHEPIAVNTDYARWLFYGWVCVFASLLWLIPKWYNSVYGTLGLIIIGVDVWSQIVYFRAFGQYGRLASLLSSHSTLINSWESIKEFFNISDWRYVWIILLFLFLSIIINLLTSKTKLKHYLTFIIGFLLTLSFAYYQVKQFDSAITEDKFSIDPFQYYKTTHYIYSTVPNTLQFVENFGVLGLLEKDIYDIWIDPFFKKESQVNNDISYFLMNKSPISKGEFAGIFEGKSVLMIESESLMQLAIDPVITPNLYRLQTYGFSFPGFNAPLLPGSTSDTELMANTSLLPVSTGENTFMNYADVTYPVTLADVFTNYGYISMAAHNNYAEFYNRDEMLPHLGYDFFDSYRMGFEGQEIEDSKFLIPIKWISIEREKFFSYWVTFNAHQPYSLELLNELFLDDYMWLGELYPNLPEAEKVYLAKVMDFDRSLGSLIIDFTNSGRVDDLVIVIFGDHFAKGAFSSDDSISQICNLGSNNCKKTPLLIWNNDTFIGSIDKKSNTLDILPTMFDLMGFDYHSEYILGNNLFDPNYLGFYFNDYGDLVFDDFSYNILEDEFVNPNNLSNQELNERLAAAQHLLDLGPKIIENNYFESDEFLDSYPK